MSCIIVMGCYRSGTSVIAGILNHLGIPMGKKFDSPNENNVDGYWEDIEFKEMHKSFDAGEADENPSLPLRYSELIQKREQEFEIWGIKDPLLCTNLSRFVSNLSVPHRLIVCRRPTHDISASMSKALAVKDPLRFVNLADFYVDCMNKQLLNYNGPILEMDHSQTIKNPEFHINRISNFLSMPVTKKALSYIKNKKV